ncbi:MAG: hypothetical protein KY475_07815 [Planctomycetes bacterium]|nr:hypothetical protein [Planctomycetota bacterium]
MDGWRTLRVGVTAHVSILLIAAAAAAQTERGSVCALTSPHFVLHTDLPDREARQALARMEATLSFVADYWKVRPRGNKIQCYLVDNQEHWRDAQLPHPLARISTGGIGGATVSESVGAGRDARREAVIYASTTPGVVEHEVVHAYCLHAFGTTGPDWYKEGMAEMAAFRGDGQSGVRCPAERVRELRGEAPKSIRNIVEANSMTGEISHSIGLMVSGGNRNRRQVPMSEWTERDAANVRQARLDYFWSWALCHLLVHNPNYSDRFHLLGDSYLLGRDDSFERMFASMSPELEFEYRLFLEHVDVGYRADLCAWDWRTRFRSLERSGASPRPVAAARGFQASGVNVAKHARYAYRALGVWSTSADATTDANGDREGRGRLQGVILSDFTLSEAFPLGAEGVFTAPATGKLYLRCRDGWSELSDNRGEIEVVLSQP